jgi:hypothetical protein
MGEDKQLHGMGEVINVSVYDIGISKPPTYK